MKMHSINLKNLGLAVALMAIGNPIITSCSKEQDKTEHPSVSDKLTISINGILLDPSFKSASSKINYDVKEFGDADIAIGISDVSPSESVKFRSSAVYEPIEENVKYVIYIYENDNLVASKLLSAGTPGTIENLNRNTNYKWVAVSYNDTENAPSIAPSGDITLPENTDVLYASGNLNLSQSSTIAIAFNHAMARLAVELNTIGVFGEISGNPTVTIKSAGLRTGNLNLLTGNITANSTTFSPTLSFSDFEQVEDGKNDALHTYFYTVPTTTSENQPIVVNIKNLTINHYEGNNQTRTYFGTNNGVDFTLNITAEKGKSKKAVLNIVESALETRIGTTNVGWARSNLYYRGGTGVDENRSYAFNYTNRMHATGNSYFAFNTKLPLYFPKTNADLGDPCLEVYPKNLWRSPTKTELGLLASGDLDITPLVDEVAGTLTNILDGVLGSLLGGATAPNSYTNTFPSNVAGKTEYQTSIIQRGRPSSGSNAFGDGNSHSNKLTFFYNGQVTNTTVLQSLASADQAGLISLRTSDLSANSSGALLGLQIPILPAYSNTAALWSNTDGVDLLELAGAGSWGYFSYQNVAVGGLITLGTSNARTSAELLDLELLNTGLIESSMKNVRCVRSTAPVFN